jgi:hypothetical protein
MTDAELIEIIADGIVDGTDMDCTTVDQARAVLKALRDAGVFEAEWKRGRDAAAHCVYLARIGEADGDFRCIISNIKALTPEAPQ